MTIPILVDCDQVLSDFLQSVLDLAAEKYNVFATKEDCTKDPPWDAIGCPYLPANINEAIAKGEFVYRMKPLTGGIEFLRDLESSFGQKNVYICTAPWNGEWASQRLDWLRDIAKVPMKRVITTSCKYLVQGILIDDSVKHLVNRDFGYCIAQPYNTEFKGPRGNYKECLEWLKEITK